MDNQAVSEIEYLKSKCNQQVDHINALQHQLEDKEKTINDFEKGFAKTNGLKGSLNNNLSSSFMEVFNILYQVIELSIKNTAFFETKRTTSFTKVYKTIDFKVLSSFIEQVTDSYAPNKILKIWAGLGLVFQDENEKPI